MKALLFDSSTRKLYVAFIVWGLVQGGIQYFILLQIAPRRLADDLGALEVSVLFGGIISAVVFGLLFKIHRWLLTLGFLVVGTLIPSAVIMARIFLYFRTYLDPVTLGIIFFSTICSLPFTLFATALYCLVLLISHRTRAVNAD